MKSPTNVKVARSSPREGTGQIRRERHHDCLRPRDSRSLPCPRHLSPLTVDKRAPAEPAQNRRFVHPNQGALHLYAFLIKWQIRWNSHDSVSCVEPRTVEESPRIPKQFFSHAASAL